MPRTSVAATDPLQCSTLRRACVTLHKAQPTCSSRCRPSQKPFRIDVYGTHAERDINTTVALLQGLKDPLNTFVLRHLERDLYVAPPGQQPPRALSNEPAHMLWPLWESGFSEVLMWTLLPLGYLAHLGRLPNTTWMISGALMTRSWEPLARMSRGGLCTFERDLQVEDMRVSNPLPRCPPRTCHKRLNLCRVMDHVVTHENSYQGRMALDAALGFPTPSLYPPPRPRAASPPGQPPQELTILFARRHSWHGRHILNQQELVDSCSNSTRAPDGWRLRCMAVSLGSGTLSDTIKLLRSADVLVGMHGGELINAMHMLPGKALFEVVNHGFHLAGNGWLNHYWIHTSPVVRHVRIVLPPPPGNCLRPVDIAWNANASLPLDLFWDALNETVLSPSPAAAALAALRQDRPTTVCPLHSRCFGHHRDVGHERAACADGAAEAAAMPTTAALGPPLSHQAVFTWLTTHAETGFCGKTVHRRDGACAAGHAASGAWQLSKRERNGPLRAAAEQCLRLCSGCARCAYISFSQRYGDCSWFTASACNLTRLSNDITGFTSGGRYVSSAASSAAAAASPSPSSFPSSSAAAAVTAATALALKPSSRFRTMEQRREYARQMFLTGRGGLWLQHVRKTAGTSLCRALSDAVSTVPDSTGGSQPPPRQPKVCTTRIDEGNSVEAAMKAWGMGARMWKSELGAFPTLARRGMVDDSLSTWVFVTCLRDPISLLISSTLYDVDYHLLVGGSASTGGHDHKAAKRGGGGDGGGDGGGGGGGGGGVVNVSALSATLLQVASGQSREPILHGCRYDNYMTRVFSSSCLDEVATGHRDLEEALATLSAFEIVLVLEWLTEMLPLVRYRLGLDVASVAHRNRNSNNEPFKYSQQSTTLSRQQLATRQVSGADDLRAQLPPATITRLKELLRFDYALFDEAKRRARAAARELPLYNQRLQ